MGKTTANDGYDGFGETRSTTDGHLGVKTSRAKSGRGNGDKNKWVDAQTFMISSPTVTNQVRVWLWCSRIDGSRVQVCCWDVGGGLLDAKARIAVFVRPSGMSWR